MATVQANAYQNRLSIDSNLTNTTAIGTAGSTVQSATIDTGDNTDGFLPEAVELLVQVPATPSLASAATVAGALTFTLLADTASTPTLASPIVSPFVLKGAAGGSGAATNYSARLYGSIPRYLAVSCAAGANAGNNSAVSFTTSLAF